MTGAAADLAWRAGFADSVHDAQQAFRTVLDAMARPGRVLALPAAVARGLASDDAALAPPFAPARAAVLLALLDTETPVLLDDAAALPWLRFHTGAPAAAAGQPVAFASVAAARADAALCARLALGSDESPQDGATLVVEVDGLGDDLPGITLALRGPGIPDVQRLVVAGLPATFWAWREALRRELPRGVEIVLVHGTRLAAIPRSTSLVVED